MLKLLRLFLLIGGLSLLMLVAWLAVLRAEEADSNMIVFVSYRSHRSGEGIGLYSMTADGSSVRHIFSPDSSDKWVSEPAWSPDGEWIAFSMSDPVVADIHIYLVRVDGCELRRLTHKVADYYGGAVWSPDSQRIAYTDGYNVFVTGVNGNGQIQITEDGYNFHPAWSPDGKWIVFSRNLNASYSIYRVRPDGSRLQMLTSGEYREYDPTFSPDGASIIFVSDPGQNRQAGYYQMRLPTGEAVMLDDPFRHYVSNLPVDWSASGEWAVYEEETGLNREVTRIRADGSQVQQLTFHDLLDGDPAWSPPISLAWRGWINALVGITMLVLWMVVTMREKSG